jgi:hypothetical protein
METLHPAQSPAECRAKAKMGFINHLVVYLLVIGMLAIVNLLTDRQHVWVYWPMFGWGIAVIMHGLGVFVFNPEGRLYGRLLDREKRHSL